MMKTSLGSVCTGFLFCGLALTSPLFGQLTPGATVQGAISAFGEVDPYTLSGVAGDKITVRVIRTSGTGNPHLTLLGPDGATLANSSNGLVDFSLPVSGVYSVSVRDVGGSGTFNYSLVYQRLNNPANSTAFVPGTTLNHRILAPGETRFYRIAGVRGDKLSIQMIKTNGVSAMWMELYSSAGERMATASNGRIDARVVVPGPHTVLVRSYSGFELYDFSLVWQRWNNPAATGALNPGIAVSAGITAAGQTKFYSMSVAAGDKIAVRMLKVSGASAMWMEVWDPSGRSLGQRSDGQLQTTATLPGIHTILVRSYSGVQLFDYTLLWQRWNSPGNTTSLPQGTTLNQAIAIAGQTKFYTFAATAGDKVTVRMLKTGGASAMWMEVWNPIGSQLAARTDGTANIIANVTGLYVILARSYSGVDLYQFSLVWQRWNSPSNAAPLTSGVILNSTIGAAGQTNFYSISAAAGDKLSVRMLKTSGSSAMWMELWDPTGTQLSARSDGRIELSTTVSGAHTLLIRSYSGLDLYTFTLVWQRWNSPTNTTLLSPGVTLPHSITAAGQTKYYRIDAVIGDQLAVRMLKTSGASAMWMELWDSNGTELGARSDGVINAAAAVTGPLTLLVRSYSGVELFGYSLVWQRFNNPAVTTLIKPGYPVYPSIAVAGRTQFFRFTGAAGDSITLRMLKIGGTGAMWMELWDASGRQLGAASNGEINAVLDLTGVCTVLARSYSGVDTLNYSLVWQRLNAPGNTTLLTGGLMQYSNISRDGETDFFRLMGAAGDRVTLRLTRTSTALATYLELWSPIGGRLGAVSNGQIDATLPVAGVYTVVARSYTGLGVFNYSHAFQRVSDPLNALPVGCGQTVHGTIGTSGEMDFYAFGAVAGTQVRLAASITSGSGGLFLELISPLGGTLGTTLSGILDRTLPHNGPYTIVLRSASGTDTFSYDLSRLPLGGPCVPPPIAISSVQPAQGGDSGSVGVRIAGPQFLPGSTVLLRRAGSPDILGGPATLAPGGWSLTTNLNLAGKAQGLWDVVVEHPKQGTAVVPEAFSIKPVRQAQCVLQVAGSMLVEPGAPEEFAVLCRNDGNVDLEGATLVVEVPRDSQVRFVHPVSGKPVAMHFNIAQQRLISIPIPTVGAGETFVLDLTVQLDAGLWRPEDRYALTAEVQSPSLARVRIVAEGSAIERQEPVEE